MTSSAHQKTSARPYRPSNGTEGRFFMADFCDRCERDRAFREDRGDSCEIAAATMAYSVTDSEYPPEWIEDEAGPRCTAFDPTPDQRADDWEGV